MKFENEEINRLNAEYLLNEDAEKKLIDENFCLTEAKKVLENHSKNTDDISTLIEFNMTEIKKLYENRKSLKNQINEIRLSCEHDWKDNGWDSHHNYYVCKKCGAECKI